MDRRSSSDGQHIRLPTEILELILSFLPLKDIAISQRVSQTWKTIISTSPLVRKCLFQSSTEPDDKLWQLIFDPKTKQWRFVSVPLVLGTADMSTYYFLHDRHYSTRGARNGRATLWRPSPNDWPEYRVRPVHLHPFLGIYPGFNHAEGPSSIRLSKGAAEETFFTINNIVKMHNFGPALRKAFLTDPPIFNGTVCVSWWFPKRTLRLSGYFERPLVNASGLIFEDLLQAIFGMRGSMILEQGLYQRDRVPRTNFSDVLEILQLRGYDLRQKHRIKGHIHIKLSGIAVASEEEWKTVGQVIEDGKRIWL